jgi:predicted phosphodiesterase
VSGKPTYTLPDRDTLQQMLHEHGVYAVAEKIGMSGSALTYRAKKMGLSTAKGSAPNGAPGGETHTLEVEPGADLSPEKLLKRVGLDPEQWVVTNVKAREGTWGSPDAPNEQLRLEVSVRPISGMVRAPDLKNWKPLPKPKPRKRKDTEPLRAVSIGDHHAPRNEKVFHRLFVQWLRDHQPDVIHVNGDLLDFPSVSRHRTEDDFNHDINECLRVAHTILRDYRDACPNASISYLRGNHCERLRYYLADNAPEVKDVRPGGDPDETPWHDLRRLLWLDQLHVDYIDAPWEQAKKTLGKRLTIRHGFSTSPNAGKVILDKLSGSTIQGHDHRLNMTLRTRHTGDDDDPIEVRLAMSGGCACEIPGGLGYVNGGEPDWANGAVAVDIYDNDDFYCSPMLYVPGRLLTREGRYTA